MSFNSAKKFWIILFCFSIIFSFTYSAKAHHGGEGNINGPGLAGPIITIPAFTLPKGTNIRLIFNFTRVF